MKILEWFLMLFLKKKALSVKQEAIFERQAEIIKYEKTKEANKNYLKRLSSKGRRFVKAS
jgi:hypothetical protein